MLLPPACAVGTARLCRIGRIGSAIVEDTWTNRELPVLQVIVAAFEDPDRLGLRVWDLIKLCGLPEGDVQLALRALWEASPPFIEAARPPEEMTYPVHIIGVTERARRAVGQWPTPENLLARLVDGFNDAADQEPDPVRKKRLREAAGLLGETARGVAVDVIAKMIMHAGGMG